MAMTITADDPFKSAPRISRDEFRRRINMQAAPGVIAERDAGEYWDAIKATGVDPLFILAMFQHESTMGKFGMARSTHSWGNTRPPSFGVPHLSTDNNFSIYRDWLDGVKSTAARLVAPNWVYYNRTSIREIFIHPSGMVWAPAGDNNNPDGYLNAVLRDMNAWADGGEPMPLTPPAGWTPPPIRIAYIPATNMNRPGTKITVRQNVWHDTGNPSVGANAEAHRKFVLGGGGKDSTSYQYVVDDHEIIALIPEGEKAFHALDPCNSESNGIELCINSDGDWDRTLWNGAWLGHLLETHGVTRHIQHFTCTQKNCPAKLRDSGTWTDFLDRIASFRTPAPDPAPAVQFFPETGFSVGGGFLQFWLAKGGIQIFGYPITEEFVEKGHTVQYFERARFEHHPNSNPTLWDVMLGRIGAELIGYDG